MVPADIMVIDSFFGTDQTPRSLRVEGFRIFRWAMGKDPPRESSGLSLTRYLWKGTFGKCYLN
jgi:hypothetical protein